MNKRNLICWIFYLIFLVTVSALNATAKTYTRDNKFYFEDFTYVKDKSTYTKSRPIRFASLRHCIHKQPFGVPDNSWLDGKTQDAKTYFTIKAGRHNYKSNKTCILNTMLAKEKENAINYLIGNDYIGNVNFALQGDLVFYGLGSSDYKAIDQIFKDIVLVQTQAVVLGSHSERIGNVWLFGGPNCQRFDYKKCGKKCNNLGGIANCTSTAGKNWCFIRDSNSYGIIYLREPCSVSLLQNNL